MSLADRGWMARAACREHRELFWRCLPEKDWEHRSWAAQCRSVCLSCPVFTECRSYAERSPPGAVAGVLAGQTEAARARRWRRVERERVEREEGGRKLAEETERGVVTRCRWCGEIVASPVGCPYSPDGAHVEVSDPAKWLLRISESERSRVQTECAHAQITPLKPRVLAPKDAAERARWRAAEAI